MVGTAAQAKALWLVGPSSAQTGHPWVLLPDPGAMQAECRELEAQDLGIVHTCLSSGA